MPIKFKPSAKTRDRNTGKVKTEHYYIKCMSQEELFKELNSDTFWEWKAWHLNNKIEQSFFLSQLKSHVKYLLLFTTWIYDRSLAIIDTFQEVRVLHSCHGFNFSREKLLESLLCIIKNFDSHFLFSLDIVS